MIRLVRPLQQQVQGVLDPLFGQHIDRTGGFVEQDDPGIAHHGANETDQLSLAVGDVFAMLTDLRLESVGQAFEKGPCSPGRRWLGGSSSSDGVRDCRRECSRMHVPGKQVRCAWGTRADLAAQLTVCSSWYSHRSRPRRSTRSGTLIELAKQGSCRVVFPLPV
jgi:hypothetical protein